MGLGALVALIVVNAVGFGTKTMCTTDFERDCGHIDALAWATFGAASATLVIGVWRKRPVIAATAAVLAVGCAAMFATM